MAVFPHKAPNSERGRKQLLAVILGGTLLLLLVAWLSSFRPGPFRPTVQFGRIAVFLVLGVLLYRGQVWARWLVIIWLGLFALTGVVGFASMLGQPIPMLLFAVVAAFAGWGAWVLASSVDIDGYLLDRKSSAASRRTATPPVSGANAPKSGP
jgi:hypothetical protein